MEPHLGHLPPVDAERDPMPGAVPGDRSPGRVPPRLSRRRFLAVSAAGATAGVAVGAGAYLWEGGSLSSHLAAHGAAPTSTAGAGDGPILVVVTLYGGNDGLNTVVPTDDSSYAAARGPLALDAGSLLPLTDGFGLHASMTGFQKLFQQGQLAVILGVGYPDGSLSHFESMDIWQSAQTDGDQDSGWIGRWLDATGTDPLRATAIGPTLPLALMGEKAQGAAVPPPPLTLPGPGPEQSAYVGMQSVSAGEATLLADVARSGSDLLAVQRTLAPVLDGAGSASGAPGTGTNLEGAAAGLAIAQGGGGRASASVLSDQLDLVATMIGAAVPTKVYAVSFGGFDTHTDQESTQSALLSQLDAAVAAFLGQVRGSSHGRAVVVVIHTEFGRRVLGNASGGSDHGTANVVFVAGSTVKGGFYGDAPSLTSLDANGNLVFSTDFRSVYATLLGSVVGIDPHDVLGARYRTLPVLA